MHYVVSSSNNHWYCLSLWWTYCAKPTSLGVLFTSLELFLFLVLPVPAFLLLIYHFFGEFCGFSIVPSSSSFNFIILASTHVVESSSSTLLVIVFASTNLAISLLYVSVGASYGSSSTFDSFLGLKIELLIVLGTWIPNS